MKPEAKWHKFPVSCPKCGKEIAILAVSFSADGYILVEGNCAHCGKEVQWTQSFFKLIFVCYCTDRTERGQWQDGNNLIN